MYADLAPVHSMDKMKELNETLKESSISGASVWIGLQRGDTEKWTWSLADTKFNKRGETFRNWLSTQRCKRYLYRIFSEMGIKS
ncbi:hypothetical protein SRHO_G00285440 [Serrasalmus rhombeus]